MAAPVPPGTLLVVATPLGNLQDITPRAIEALRRAGLVACEDTRRTRGLLTHFGIHPPRVVSCHKFNERSQAEPILEILRSGADVALVSDSGTPGLSDPGALVVEAALSAGLPVSPIPGPSAAAAALSASGFSCGTFLFAGFLPRKAGARRAILETIAAEERPIIVYEAPHRVAAVTADLAAMLGDRPVTLVREVTKRHEEVRRTTLSRLAADLSATEPRGEFTLVVGPAPAGGGGAPGGGEPAAPDDAVLRARYAALLAAGESPAAALKTMVKQTGMPRRSLYALLRAHPAGG